MMFFEKFVNADEGKIVYLIILPLKLICAGRFVKYSPSTAGI